MGNSVPFYGFSPLFANIPEALMNRKTLRSVLSLLLGVAVGGCASLTLEDVDSGWPVETVAKVGPDNRVVDTRYALSARVTSLAMEEFQDTSALVGRDLRIIRSKEGYYFMTGQRFKNVYVFAPSDGSFSLEKKIEVSPTGLQSPALNQRSPYIELVDGSVKRLLDEDGIVKGNGQ
jgi:hypothetical protein